MMYSIDQVKRLRDKGIALFPGKPDKLSGEQKVLSIHFAKKFFTKTSAMDWLKLNDKEGLYKITETDKEFAASFYYYEDDKIGKHKVIEQPNGVKVRLLVEPSEWYTDKQRVNGEKQKQAAAEKQKIEKANKAIQDRMKDIAKQQLIDEGVLNADGTLK